MAVSRSLFCFELFALLENESLDDVLYKVMGTEQCWGGDPPHCLAHPLVRARGPREWKVGQRAPACPAPPLGASAAAGQARGCVGRGTAGCCQAPHPVLTRQRPCQAFPAQVWGHERGYLGVGSGEDASFPQVHPCLPHTHPVPAHRCARGGLGPGSPAPGGGGERPSGGAGAGPLPVASKCTPQRGRVSGALQTARRAPQSHHGGRQKGENRKKYTAT